MSIMVFGSINMDLTTYVPRLPKPGETLHGTSYLTVPGGKGANQAVAAARLEAPTLLCGRVGADAFGQEHLASLRKEGVDVSRVMVDEGYDTGLAVISVDDQAENAIVVVSGANMAVGMEDVHRCLPALEGCKFVLLQLEVPLEASMALARAARERGIPVMLDPAPAGPVPLEFYPLVDILTPNETELETLLGIAVGDESSARLAASKLLSLGVKTAVIKLGEQGAFYQSAAGWGWVPPFPVKAVDTVAAGDAFNAGLAAALSEGRDLEEALRWGAAAGALAVTKKGAMPSLPRRSELEGILEKAEGE